MKLESKNVELVFEDCLFRMNEDKSDSAVAEGVSSIFRFHKGRLESHKNHISSMLYQLPEEFQKDCGGGMSFLNACNNLIGEQWTDLHSVVEHLFALGLACMMVGCLAPRDVWETLSGGMPYYVVK